MTRAFRAGRVVALLVFGACSGTSPSSAEPEPKGSGAAEVNRADATKAAERPTEAVKQRSPGRGTQEVLANYYKALAARDVDWLPAFFVDGYQRTRVDAIPGMSPSMSRVKFLAGLSFLFEELPDATITPLLLLSNGNRSSAIYRIESGTGTSILHAEVAEHAEDGRFLSSRAYTSDLTFVVQAGVRPRVTAAAAPFEWPPLQTIAADDSAAEKANLVVAERARSAAIARTTKGLEKIYGPDFEFVRHNGEYRFRGLAEIRAAIRSTRQFRIKTQQEVLATWGAGDWVVTEVASTGTLMQGPLKGIPLRERPVYFSRVANGRIVELHELGNEAIVTIQMGIDDAAELRADIQEAFEKLFAGCADIRDCKTPRKPRR